MSRAPIPAETRKMKPSRPNRGFTLIELTVVVALIGVAMVVAYPRFSGLVLGRKLRGFAGELAGTLDFVRSRAVLDGRIYYFHFNRAKNEYWVTREGDGQEEPMAGRLGRGQKLPEDLFLKRVTVEGAPGTYFEPVIRFFPRGSADEAYVYLESARGDRASVWVKPYTGRSRAEMGFQKPA